MNNKDCHGFKLMDEYEIKEIESLAKVYSHEKSGAKLLHIGNNDNNKVFSIGFRTPPSNSTGVPHIIEHSVLAGSKKYTTKEPFMDMVKGSLQTFINAMTFSDKTLYPVASKNEKDFFNLMDVYLDSVLYPKIYQLPEIFMQEGWNYELFHKEDDIEYKGVVYNEMLGAYSSPERLLSDEVGRSLYPDTCYKYSSGGNPDFIPDLTYDEFLNFHKRFYHPSNSYIYLYGDGDIKKQLSFIDENYLSNFDKIEVDSDIQLQEAFLDRAESEIYYPISKDESSENRTYLNLNFVLGEVTDPEIYFMSNILGELLISSSAAPLKKALINNGIGEDIIPISSGGLQTSFGIVAKNTSIDKKEEFEKIIFQTLEDLIQEGIDKDLIRACLNIAEYDLREAGEFPTKGLIYNMQSLDSWIYDGHPTTHLQYEDVLNRLKGNVDTDYFENFIEDKLLNNKHSSFIVMIPDKNLAEEKDIKRKEKLANYKDSLSDEEVESLIQKNNKLKEIQLAQDTEEDKATIPKLSIADVDPKVPVIPQEIIEEDDYTLLFHNIFTNKIGYLDFYFDISIVDEELIPYINLLTSILGEIDTETMSYSDLSNEIYINTGGINLNANTYTKDNKDHEHSPKFIVGGKAIGDNLITLIELISKLTRESKIEDDKRIKEILQQLKSRIEMSIYDSGHAVVSHRVGSYFSPSIKYMEQLNGLDFYWFLSDILKDFDSNSQEIISNLNKVYNTIFNINNLIIGFTGDEEDFTIVRDNLSILTEKLNRESFPSKTYSFTEEKLNEGILSSANVQYVSKGYNFKNLGYDYKGSMGVLGSILSIDYLHNNIRARGGAYGAGIAFNRTGRMTTYSYRDPNLKETIEVYDNMANYIENLEISQEDLTTYIIGTIGSLDPATTPHMKGLMATSRYLSNISHEDVQRIKDQVLNTTIDEIKGFGPLLKDTMGKEYLCVLGNEDKLRENKEVFNKLIPLKR